MSEYGILKWSLVVAALLAIFTKVPRVMEGDGGPSLLEQRDPYGYGGRFAGEPVDVWLTIEATNRKTDTVNAASKAFWKLFPTFFRKRFRSGVDFFKR